MVPEIIQDQSGKFASLNGSHVREPFIIKGFVYNIHVYIVIPCDIDIIIQSHFLHTYINLINVCLRPSLCNLINN